MKWLILLLIILAVVAVLVFRYRRQILTGWQLLKMFRQMRQFGSPSEKQIKPRRKGKEEIKSAELVRCSRCNKWVPEGGALNLRGKNFYCSEQCLEKAVRIASLVD